MWTTHHLLCKKRWNSEQNCNSSCLTRAWCWLQAGADLPGLRLCRAVCWERMEAQSPNSFKTPLPDSAASREEPQASRRRSSWAASFALLFIYYLFPYPLLGATSLLHVQKGCRTNMGSPSKSGGNSYKIQIWGKVLTALACSNWPKNAGPKQVTMLNHLHSWPAESKFIKTHSALCRRGFKSVRFKRSVISEYFRLKIINNTEDCVTSLWSASAPELRGCFD